MKTIFNLALVGSAVIAAPAVAATNGSTHITGTLASSCAIVAPPAATFDPSMTTQQALGSASYQCNFIGNASLKFWSTNGGQVVMPSGPGNGNVAQSRIYSLEFDGTNLGQVSNSSGAATSATRAISAFNTNQSGALKMQLQAAASVAGTYDDTIFMSIAP